MVTINLSTFIEFVFGYSGLFVFSISVDCFRKARCSLVFVPPFFLMSNSSPERQMSSIRTILQSSQALQGVMAEQFRASNSSSGG